MRTADGSPLDAGRQMKRYDLVQINACYTSDHEMEAADDGEWVRYEDVEAIIAPSSPSERLDQLIAKWRDRQQPYWPTEQPVADVYASCADELETLVREAVPSLQPQNLKLIHKLASFTIHTETCCQQHLLDDGCSCGLKELLREAGSVGAALPAAPGGPQEPTP